ncbi:type VII secretion system-associated protein [Streptomyces sp. NPDC048279]|uniref:type VII secretion system-associated protein n=1 Tax=Streptomyces sp. NPDC048279 TaxID=3154714 RepID=UPI003434BE2A
MSESSNVSPTPTLPAEVPPRPEPDGLKPDDLEPDDVDLADLDLADLGLADQASEGLAADATPGQLAEADGTAPAGRRDEDMPTPPEEFVSAARLAPDHWFYLPDPTWEGEGPPPEWAVLGRWRSDRTGEIVEWESNDEYRPSPEALGWPEPVGPVDAAVQRAATGYGEEAEVPRALAEADVAVMVEDDGALMVTTAPDDEPAVPVFTPSPHLEADLPPHTVMPVRDLISLLPTGAERLLYLSPSAPVAMTVVAEALRLLLGLDEADTAPLPTTGADGPAADDALGEPEPARPIETTTEADHATPATAAAAAVEATAEGSA